MKKLILLCVFFFTISFVTIHEANALSITAIPKSPSFGPNDWIIIGLKIQGYGGGPVTWVAHRPDNSTISGSIYQINGGVASHEIQRSAYDNYFGKWSIDYMYSGVKQTISFQVNPIVLTVLTDKELYYEPDIMQINITSSYYIPVASHAGLYDLNFYDQKGNSATYIPPIEIRAIQPSIVYSYPISQLIKYNPPGLYKLKVQYYNKIVEVPFLLGEYRTFMQISAQTDKPGYKLGEDVNFDLLVTRVSQSGGVLKIIDPSGNTTSHPFNLDSVHTSLVLRGITNKIGTYQYEIQYANINQKGSYIVAPNPTQLPNIELGIFLDKLNYRPGEIIHAKIHTSQIVTDSIASWVTDPNGTSYHVLFFTFTANDITLPHGIAKNDILGQWEFYVDYDGIIKSVPFFIRGEQVIDDEITIANQYNIPRFVSQFNSSYFSEPTAIAIDSNDNIYVVDYGDAKIQKFDSDGLLLLTWGGLGTGNGQFNHPEGITIGNKYVYVADAGNARIQMFDKNGNFIYAWGGYGDERGMFHLPVALALDQSGDLFVADAGRNTIQIFDSHDMYSNEMRPLLTVGANFSATNGIVFDSENNYYTSTTDNKILKFSDSGNFINFYGSYGTEDGRFNTPTSIAIDSKGYFYVADTNNHRIQKFDPNGNFILSWGSQGNAIGQFEEPVGLAIDPSDNIYVVDKGTNKIQKFSLYSFTNKTVIPSWLSDNALWWSEGALDKNNFAQVVRYMINQGLIHKTGSEQNYVKIPLWIKADASWWASGEIDYNTFVQTLQYLISAGILIV